MVSFQKSSQEGSSRNAVEEPTGRDDNVLSIQKGSSRNAVEEPTGRKDTQKHSGWSSLHGEKSLNGMISIRAKSSRNGSPRNASEDRFGRVDSKLHRNGCSNIGEKSMMQKQNTAQTKSKPYRKNRAVRTKKLVQCRALDDLVSRTSRFLILVCLCGIGHATRGDYCFHATQTDQNTQKQLYETVQGYTSPHHGPLIEKHQARLCSKLETLKYFVGFWRMTGKNGGVAYIEVDERTNGLPQLVLTWKRNCNRRCQFFKPKPLGAWTIASGSNQRLVLFVSENNRYWVITPKMDTVGNLTLDFKSMLYPQNTASSYQKAGYQRDVDHDKLLGLMRGYYGNETRQNKDREARRERTRGAHRGRPSGEARRERSREARQERVEPGYQAAAYSRPPRRQRSAGSGTQSFEITTEYLRKTTKNINHCEQADFQKMLHQQRMKQDQQSDACRAAAARPSSTGRKKVSEASTGEVPAHKIKSLWDVDESGKDLENHTPVFGWVCQNCNDSNGYFLKRRRGALVPHVVAQASTSIGYLRFQKDGEEVSLNPNGQPCRCNAVQPTTGYYRTKRNLTNRDNGQRYEIEYVINNK